MLTGPADFMDCALSLAKLALGYTSPNPAVGAVVVKDGLIVGLGYTQPPGLAHAEAMALGQAREKARDAVMYVTMEPCCHFGRTPPCTKAIINAGISEVHVAMLDPNPVVSGRGLEELEKAGIKIYFGEYQERAQEINEAYVKFITTGIPFVTAKFAMSIDGKIATRSGDSKWISSDDARKYVHNLRHTVDAIMVGANTVIIDDPRLTARGGCGKGGRTKLQPLRVIVDGKGRTPLSAQLLKQPGKTVIAVAKPLAKKKMKGFKEAGAEVIELPAEGDLIDLAELLTELGKRSITSVLVEGGGMLLGYLFDRGLVDKVLAFVSPIIIGGEEAKTAVGGKGVDRVIEGLQLTQVGVERIGDSVLISGYLSKGQNVYRTC